MEPGGPKQKPDEVAKRRAEGVSPERRVVKLITGAGKGVEFVVFKPRTPPVAAMPAAPPPVAAKPAAPQPVAARPVAPQPVAARSVAPQAQPVTNPGVPATTPASPAPETAVAASNATEGKAGPAQPKKSLRLTDRDRQLMGMLATVRFLTREQLQRLVFAERDGINLHKRLLALAGEGKYGVEQPYLRKLSYRNWEGMPQTAWTLTPLGYNVAASVLPEPPRCPAVDTGANFIEHGLMLNELYVQLLEAPLKRSLATARVRAATEKRPSRGFDRVKAGLYARAAHPQFHWQSHDEVRLPWREFEMKTGKTFNRVIIPDATLVVPGRVTGRDVVGNPREYSGRRYFLEAETGSHTVAAEGDTKPGATLNKLDRYVSFISPHEGLDKPTWYTKEYPDNFEPVLLFLVRSAGRQSTVNRALNERQSQGNRYRIRAHALTVDVAAAELLSLLGPDWGDAPAARGEQLRRPAITSGEYRLLRDFVGHALKVIQDCREVARTIGFALPEYPSERDAVQALIRRVNARKPG